MKKQLLSILLCLIMVVGLLPTAALAEEAEPPFNLATDLEGIEIPNNLVTCICTTTNESKQYGQLTDGFSATKVAKEGSVWTVIIRVKPDVYKAQFNKDMDCEHAADMNHSTDFTTGIQFKLKYEGGKWVLLGKMPQNKMLHFTCSGGHVYQGDIPVIELVTRTHTDIKVTENDKWEYSKDNGATWQGSCHFTNLRPGTEYSIIARVKATATHKPSANSTPLNVTTMHTDISDELKDKLRAVASAYEGEYNGTEHEAVIVDTAKLPTGWTIAGYTTDGGTSYGNSIPKIKDAGTLGVGVKFVHPDYLMNITHSYTAKVTPTTITEGDLARLNIPANLVTVKCQTTGDSKAYGKIHGGFDLSSSKPYMDNGVLKAIVKLNLPAYKDKYDVDTKKTHENAGVERNPHMAFTLKYVNSKWMIDGNFPAVVLLVTCDGSHENQTYTVTFDGNGGRPTNSTMTTTGKKLASLPTATRSGRYSFDGWYTKKNGGTKITTATLFDKDTTVYAHWTYTGSTGGGVTTYPITVKSAKNGDVTASHKSAAKGTTITLTVDPDKGYVLDTLTVLDGKDKEIKLTEKNGKYTFKMPDSKVEIQATFVKETEISPFGDVSTDAYYYEAVKWAQKKGITGGIGNDLFGPNQPCTRAQIATFLWRAAGSPEPKNMSSFSDVPTDSYYAKAVAWAVENGITTGTGDGKFSPNAPCTRAQSVTFLYRASGSPAVSDSAVFADVEANAFYADAVAWAVANGVTNGTTSSTFSPDNGCTRAQIVTFLYRAFNK